MRFASGESIFCDDAGNSAPWARCWSEATHRRGPAGRFRFQLPKRSARIGQPAGCRKGDRRLPFLPDSNEFLACHWSGGEPRQVLICDPDGFETKIERKQKLTGQESENFRRLLTYAPLYTSGWEGSTAVVSRYTEVLSLDTVKKTLTFDGAGRPVAEGETAPWRQHVFKTNLGLRLLPVESGSNSYRLEVIKVTDKHVKQRRFRSGLVNPLFSVAPAGKHLAVRYQDSVNKDLIVVFDDEAEVVAELEVDMSR
jgi:hypothetical protein